MIFINIIYADSKEYSYMVPRIDPAKIEQLKAAPGVREVRVRGNTKGNRFEVTYQSGATQMVISKTKAHSVEIEKDLNKMLVIGNVIKWKILQEKKDGQTALV